MIKSYLRGNEIEFINNEWIYSDTKAPIKKTHKKRACGKCNKLETIEGHDNCLGTLNLAINACCGHGNEDDAYIQFDTEFSIYGKDATIIIEILKKYK